MVDEDKTPLLNLLVYLNIVNSQNKVSIHPNHAKNYLINELQKH